MATLQKLSQKDLQASLGGFRSFFQDLTDDVDKYFETYMDIGVADENNVQLRTDMLRLSKEWSVTRRKGAAMVWDVIYFISILQGVVTSFHGKLQSSLLGSTSKVDFRDKRVIVSAYAEKLTSERAGFVDLEAAVLSYVTSLLDFFKGWMEVLPKHPALQAPPPERHMALESRFALLSDALRSIDNAIRKVKDEFEAATKLEDEAAFMKEVRSASRIQYEFVEVLAKCVEAVVL